jgi:hypothetical protein
MNLDQELADALRRKDPPADLAGRVMARIESNEAPATRWWALPAFGARALVAASVVLIVVIGLGVMRQMEQRRERERGELAARQVMTALQIASESLNDAMRSVRP